MHQLGEVACPWLCMGMVARPSFVNGFMATQAVAMALASSARRVEGPGHWPIGLHSVQECNERVSPRRSLAGEAESGSRPPAWQGNQPQEDDADDRKPDAKICIRCRSVPLPTSQAALEGKRCHLRLKLTVRISGRGRALGPAVPDYAAQGVELPLRQQQKIACRITTKARSRARRPGSAKQAVAIERPLRAIWPTTSSGGRNAPSTDQP